MGGIGVVLLAGASFASKYRPGWPGVTRRFTKDDLESLQNNRWARIGIALMVLGLLLKVSDSLVGWILGSD